jgi:hypothetical protein
MEIGDAKPHGCDSCCIYGSRKDAASQQYAALNGALESIDRAQLRTHI